MKTIGLLGGMSWESTAIYYKQINEAVRYKLGGLHSAKLILWSFDFDEIVQLQAHGDWQGATRHMVEAAQALKKAGADALMICTNTMHKMAPDIEQATGLPLLHIVDATAEAIQADGAKKVALLATAFTMEQDFYKARMAEQHGVETIVPEAATRKEVHRIIYEELCQGIIRPESKAFYLETIQTLQQQGTQGIILGCTEIGMLVQQTDTPIPLYDSTLLHASYAANYALETNTQ